MKNKEEKIYKEEVKKINWKKVVLAINDIVDNDWGFEMIDLKKDLSNPDEDKYKRFTQKEAIEMSKALGKIYSLSHTVHCKACRRELSYKLNK